MNKESNLGAVLNAQSALELLCYADLHQQHFITQVQLAGETRRRAPCNCHTSQGQRLSREVACSLSTNQCKAMCHGTKHSLVCAQDLQLLDYDTEI